jgi:hypothetical protein
VKDENDDLHADSDILNRWKNYLSHLLNVHNVRDVRQIEIHTADPPVPCPSLLEAGFVISKLKKYKSAGNDQILTDLIQTVGELLLSAIHKIVNAAWNKEEFPGQWKE